jgi:hypothetical protein
VNQLTSDTSVESELERRAKIILLSEAADEGLRVLRERIGTSGRNFRS